MSRSMGKFVTSYTDYSVTANHDLIRLVIASEDDLAQQCLADNENLTSYELSELVKQGNEVARRLIAMRTDISLELLATLIEDKVEAVRVEALGNCLSSLEGFKNAVMHEKFSARGKVRFLYSDHVVTNIAVFEYLWNTVKGAPAILLERLSMAVFLEHPNIDAHLFQFIHEQMQKGDADKATRASYAENWRVTTPELLDQMKDDEYRPVINGIAGNPRAWVSTHEYLVAKHKSAGIRVGVARATSDNDLLNRIYHGTTSKDIRDAVMRNPKFVLKS